jgi:hypothetical protein
MPDADFVFWVSEHICVPTTEFLIEELIYLVTYPEVETTFRIPYNGKYDINAFDL